MRYELMLPHHMKKAIDEDWPADFVYFMHQSGSEQARGPKDPAIARPIPHAHGDVGR